MEIVSFPWAIQRRHKTAFCSCLCVHNLLYFCKPKPPWRIGLFKEARPTSLKHLMQQKQLVVDLRLWWQIIADMPEARRVTIYWEAEQLSFYPRREQKAELYRGTACQHHAAKKISAAVRISAHRSLMEATSLSSTDTNRECRGSCFIIHSLCSEESRGGRKRLQPPTSAMFKACCNRSQFSTSWKLKVTHYFQANQVRDSVWHSLIEYLNQMHSREDFWCFSTP